MVREALTLETLRRLPPIEAAGLLIGRREEGFTESESALLAAWLDDDQANRLAFARAEQAWALFDDADGDEILAAMRRHALLSRANRPTWQKLVAAAAVLLLIFSAGMIAILTQSGLEPSPQRGRPAEIHYASSGKQVRPVRLPDGSNMTLDAGSAAVVRFGSDFRAVELTHGRAFFSVAPNPARPFEVSAGNRRVIAVGTEFDVGRIGHELTVTLVEGRVAIGRMDRSVAPVLLKAGQQFVEGGGRPVIRTVGVQARAATDWRIGLISFNDETLAAAVAQVNRYSEQPITIADPAARSLRITGQFRAGDAERFARTVSEIHPVRVLRTSGGIELVPAE